ncbi:unnamed protein product [Caenorhabditis auriculariae]|uniref:Uncharacterized protein n=1 Tax=Caenorhabditis auriculariae TaxID=2777116 RepID=A0A8S1HNK9_9PELO|nr:unnamed protein product [Caenorhabditis auriculariae]
MPIQDFDKYDLLGVVAVWIIFFIVIGLISVTCLNFCCIHKNDDVTVLEKWGHRKRLGIRMGPHRPSVIARQVALEGFKRDI